MKIIVCDPISPKGIALLQQRPEFQVVVLPKRLPEAELLPLVVDAVALVVRSETKVTAKVIEAAKQLRVVGRAGVGVDNVAVSYTHLDVYKRQDEHTRECHVLWAERALK